MRVMPGALEQQLHKDVHGHDRHEAVEGMPGGAGGEARAVSIQIQLTDTAAQPCMGSLEVSAVRRWATRHGHGLA